MYPGADSAYLRAELALMRLFRDLGARADEFLTLEDIERHWTAYGVRASDLPGAIDRLIKRGLLARRQDVPNQFACTVAGSNWFDEHPGWLEYHLLIPRIARARYRRQSGDRVNAGAGRRRGVDVVRPRLDVVIGR